MVPLRWAAGVSRVVAAGAGQGLWAAAAQWCQVVKLHEDRFWRPVSQQRDTLDHLYVQLSITVVNFVFLSQ